MTDQAALEEGSTDPAVETKRPLSMKEFLEGVHPGSMREVVDAWVFRNLGVGPRKYAKIPDLRLYCDVCGGERTFRSGDEKPVSTKYPHTNLEY